MLIHLAAILIFSILRFIFALESSSCTSTQYGKERNKKESVMANGNGRRRKKKGRNASTKAKEDVPVLAASRTVHLSLCFVKGVKEENGFLGVEKERTSWSKENLQLIT